MNKRLGTEINEKAQAGSALSITEIVENATTTKTLHGATTAAENLPPKSDLHKRNLAQKLD